ncbi:MAG: DUF6596 domain-containing protein [Solirubrobacteraceae bacterium]
MSLEAVARAERATVLAAVARDTRDLELAEDSVQEALLAALTQWPRQGLPERPGAWLTVVARRAAYKQLAGSRARADPAALDALAGAAEADPGAEPRIPDGRLELLLACCHPALAIEAQVALTLRTVGGLTTGEIARALLIAEATLAQRLVRAQRKLRDSGVAFERPAPERLRERLDAVLGVIYLIFTEGHAATSGDVRVRGDLCEEAVRLARIVAVLEPDDPEALGLAALLLAHDARREARTNDDGHSVPLHRQERGRYDAQKVAEAGRLLARAITFRRTGPYQVQAAIAHLHASAPTAADTDWRQIALLYEALVRMDPSPMVALNRAAAVGMADGPEAGLALLFQLSELEDHHLLHASRAELLRRAGRREEAARAYTRALELSPPGGSIRADLERRSGTLSHGSVRCTTGPMPTA